MAELPKKKNSGTWVQTSRDAHEAWGELIDRSPKAAKLMHFLTARMAEHNAVVISLNNLAELIGCSRPTIVRAVKILRDDNWIDVWQIGGSGTTNAYVVNSRVAWHGAREGIRYAIFSATVITSSTEQPKDHEKRLSEPLRAIPALMAGETMLPSGEGLPPPSQPALEGLEPDLPKTGQAMRAEGHKKDKRPETIAATPAPPNESISKENIEVTIDKQSLEYKYMNANPNDPCPCGNINPKTGSLSKFKHCHGKKR